MVEAVGGKVTRLRPGDEVFGAGTGALAKYVAVPEDALVPKPANVSFEQAAAVPWHVAGSRSWAPAGVLHPRATLVMVGAPKGNRVVGPLSHIGRTRLASLRASQKVLFFISKRSDEDLLTLRGLLEAGPVTPVAERT